MVTSECLIKPLIIRLFQFDFKLRPIRYFTAPPDAPHTVTALDVTKSEATITWQVPANDGGVSIEGYHVERCSGSSERWVRQTRTPIPEVSYQADNLIEGTEYMYRIVAVNKRGESLPSQPTEPFIAKLPYGKMIEYVVVEW